jgi:hypothetical protein
LWKGRSQWYPRYRQGMKKRESRAWFVVLIPCWHCMSFVVYRKSTWYPPIWLSVSFTMWFANASSWHLKRPSFCFVLILFHQMVRSSLSCCRRCAGVYGFADWRVLLSFFVLFHVAALMSTVYEEQKDEDGFLYIQYSGESTFGN